MQAYKDTRLSVNGVPCDDRCGRQPRNKVLRVSVGRARGFEGAENLKGILEEKRATRSEPRCGKEKVKVMTLTNQVKSDATNEANTNSFCLPNAFRSQCSVSAWEADGSVYGVTFVGRRKQIAFRCFMISRF